jgi:hypothetical protein
MYVAHRACEATQFSIGLARLLQLALQPIQNISKSQPTPESAYSLVVMFRLGLA